MFAAGFYTYSIFALIFWETRRSDFGVSMSHHVATAILIALSYIFRLVFLLDSFMPTIMLTETYQSTIDKFVTSWQFMLVSMYFLVNFALLLICLR